MKTIGDFQVIDHGIESSQYFQGCGVAWTGFKNIVTGIGSDPADAICNCLNQICQEDFDTEGMEARIIAQEGLTKLPTTPNTDKYHEENEESEMWYHVSLRWNEEKDQP